jgi:hypothetical protein
MNKKFLCIFFIATSTVSIYPTSYLNYVCLARQACASVAHHPIFISCKALAVYALKVGALYLLARSINAHRNAYREAVIAYTKPEKSYKRGKLTIVTDGLVHVKGGADEFSLKTNRILLGRAKQHATSWSERLNRLIDWITRPADRTMTLHVVSVPTNTDVSVTSRYTYTQINPVHVEGISKESKIEITTSEKNTGYQAP